MRPKIHQKEEARLLRAKGSSVGDIAKYLGVSKSSVSLWTHDVKLSLEAQNLIGNKQRQAREKAYATLRQKRIDREHAAYNFAKKIVSQARVNKEGAKILCALMYWCEGNKNSQEGVLFTNSDRRIISTFLQILRAGFSLDEKKFRVCMHLHDYHNEDEQLKFWSKTTRIPKEQFIKTFQKDHTGKQVRPGYQGCIQVRYRDAALARVLLAIGEIYMNQQGPIVQR